MKAFVYPGAVYDYGAWRLFVCMDRRWVAFTAVKKFEHEIVLNNR